MAKHILVCFFMPHSVVGKACECPVPIPVPTQSVVNRLGCEDVLLCTAVIKRKLSIVTHNQPHNCSHQFA